MSPRGDDGGGGGGARPSRLREDWRQAWPGFGLVGLVVGVLVLTAVLQADGPPAPDDDRPADVAAAPLEEAAPVPRRPPEIATPTPRVSVPEPAPAPTAKAVPRGTEDFETRSAEDYRRLVGRSGFTLQLMVACDADNARRQLADYLAREALYVLPMDYGDRRCFRICWGVYTSESAAGAARDLPPDLVARTGRPAPRAIAMVTP